MRMEAQHMRQLTPTKKTALVFRGVVAEVIFSLALGALCVLICALVFQFKFSF